MGDFLANLSLGFSVALSTLQNLGPCFLGCLVGTLIGVLPGVGPIATIAMLLPITFGLDPVGALIMLAGIYYGAQYGGSTTAILVNIPGEATSVVTTLDGHQMARQGRAGVALGIAAHRLVLRRHGRHARDRGARRAADQARADLRPGRVFLADGDGPRLRGGAGARLDPQGDRMILVGVLLLDGRHRPRDRPGAHDLRRRRSSPTASTSPCWPWACSASPRSCATSTTPRPATWSGRPIGRLLPNREDFKQADRVRSCAAPRSARSSASCPATARCSAPSPPTRWRRSIAKDPRRFGRGAIEGVAGPESANNAGAQTSFIPLLTLGIPPNAVMALMVGAMTIHGIIPGPQVMTKNPNLFWGMIASMWIGNLMLLIINLPLVGLWVRLLKVPYRLMFPAILMFCCIGIYSINITADRRDLHRASSAWSATSLIKFGFEPAPLLLGFVLGKLMEENLRRALIISRGELHDLRRAAGLAPACCVVAVDPAGRWRCCRRSARAATRSSPNSRPARRCRPRTKHCAPSAAPDVALTAANDESRGNAHEDAFCWPRGRARPRRRPAAARRRDLPDSARSP